MKDYFNSSEDESNEEETFDDETLSAAIALEVIYIIHNYDHIELM